MLQVFIGAWALFLGMLLLMLGNGMQGTLLGIRGDIVGFSTAEMSVVMSGYFLGFLGASQLAPAMIRRVGHVRVFAALGSFISAALILFPAINDPWAWTVLRVILGFCFCGVYVVAESWLNNAATNENRGKALSLYMIVQMLGIVAAQGLVSIGDPSGFIPFIVPSVLVSIAFAPILLSINPTPPFESTKPMSLRALFGVSPLGCVGMFVIGGVYSAQFAMASVYGASAGLTVPQISTFIAMFYVGGVLFQYPVGWISDRMDRRQLILIVSFMAGAVALFGVLFSQFFGVLLLTAFLFGGLSNPLYALLIAYTNDMLERDDMAAASAGLLFTNGVGAVIGPLVTGWAMSQVGPVGFWMYLTVLAMALGVYAVWRSIRRPVTPGGDETYTYAPLSPTASPVAVETAGEWAYEAAAEEEGASDTVREPMSQGS